MMDSKNLFMTRNISFYHRLDYVVLLIFCLALIYLHIEEFNFLAFFLMLAWPDAIGFYPAILYYLLFTNREEKRVPVVFYYIYNFSHGVLANVAVILIWAYFSGGLQWEMLAFPVHLGIDRGLFGFFYKSRKIAFIPLEHSAFSALKLELQSGKKQA